MITVFFFHTIGLESNCHGSERLSTPSSNMGEISSSPSRTEYALFHRNLFVSNGSPPLVGLYTSKLLVFRSRARGFDWNLVDSLGQPSMSKYKGLVAKRCMTRIYKSTSSKTLGSF